MDDRYDVIAARVLDIEGGVSDRPATEDPGGLTKYGVARRYHPVITDAQWATWSPADSYALFRAEYWDRAHCDEMPAPVAAMVFDGAIQHGVNTALGLLQEILRVRPDGRWGPVTKEALGRRDALWTAQHLLARRARYYMTLDNWEANANGWLIRLGRMYALAERLR